MLTLKNIKKDYKTGGNVVHALRGVSLEFRANEFVSVLGASGCGKTTLLNIVGGLDRYTDGDLIIGGVSTKDYSDKDWDVYRNHRIGFVFQSYNLIPHQTVLGNVEIALTIAGVSKAERKRRACEALKKVGLEKEMKKRPNQLSGGQMQRVAIARALVNNPEILLADEPTGALDSETSVQIMDLIREIAGERLVVMVTHNPELAEQYSSRIIRLSDGLVVSDSNPYNSKAEKAELMKKVDEMGRTREQLQAWLTAKRSNVKTKETAAMSHKTALGLSGRNLVAKKGRTTITSIAGSIGIIGVSLVLALRGGFTQYIANTEKDMLSAYPITITETTLNYASIIQSMENGDTENVDLSRLDDSIYVNSFLTKLANNMMSTNTITQEYLDYLDLIDEEHYYAKQISYGGDLGNNLFQDVSFEIPTPSETDINPTLNYRMSLNGLISLYKGQLETNEGASPYQSFSEMFGTVQKVTYELPNNEDYILSQYDVVAGEYPDATAEDQMVLVLNKDGGMTDLVLAQLGLLSMEQVMELFEKGEGAAEEITYISYDELLKHTYTYFPNDTVYYQSQLQSMGGQMLWQRVDSYDPKMNFIVNEKTGMQMKIGCILRAKEDTTYGSLASGLGYTPAFTEKYLNDCRTSKIAQEGKEQRVYYRDFSAWMQAMLQGSTEVQYDYEDVTLRDLGAETMPNSISIYVKDFEHKDAVTEHLKRWNTEIKANDEAAQIQYSDTVEILMTLVRGMLDAVTYVLVAFTAISLVVSSVMIGVITYVSVVERTKEIGVLRSLGARKKDIRRLFNAETFLIGLFAGGFGVAVTYVLSIPINLILGGLTGISTLAALPIGQAIAMVVISVGLTLISGLVPAKAAAKKDPVIALRTE